MKNLNVIRERYFKEPFSRRLGHLASDLSRISTFLENSMNRRTVENVLEESKFFIEWTAPEAPLNIQMQLSEIQSKLALWHLHLLHQNESHTEIEEMKRLTKIWSSKLIITSGLLNP